LQRKRRVSRRARRFSTEKRLRSPSITGSKTNLGIERLGARDRFIAGLSPLSSRHMNASQNQSPRIAPDASRFRLRIRRSGIHGVGVCAEQSIPGGRKVIEYTGERVGRPELKRRLERIQEQHGRMPRYLFRLRRSSWIDGEIGGCGAERINHCCDPSLRVRRIRGHILLFSRRPISTGEELTLDYHYRARARRVPCHCGSAQCRGTINVYRRKANLPPGLKKSFS
jgi:uncharacterized protein